MVLVDDDNGRLLQHSDLGQGFSKQLGRHRLSSPRRTVEDHVAVGQLNHDATLSAGLLHRVRLHHLFEVGHQHRLALDVLQLLAQQRDGGVDGSRSSSGGGDSSGGDLGRVDNGGGDGCRGGVGVGCNGSSGRGGGSSLVVVLLPRGLRPRSTSSCCPGGCRLRINYSSVFELRFTRSNLTGLNLRLGHKAVLLAVDRGGGRCVDRDEGRDHAEDQRESLTCPLRFVQRVEVLSVVARRDL